MSRQETYSLSGLLLILFLIFQIFFSFQSEKSVLSEIGILQLLCITTFLFIFSSCKNAPIKIIYAIIALYQLILVWIFFQFYLIQYQNPLGFDPIDAAYYHELASNLKKKEFLDVFHHLTRTLDLGDIGFPFVLQTIYRIAGENEIFITKIFNVLFHLLTCHFLYKLSLLLLSDSRISKVLVILYGLAPASVFFNSLGLKEPLFALIVVLSFYFLFYAYSSNSKFKYIVAFLLVLCTGLFRSAYPIFIVFSFGFFLLTATTGKFKFLKRFFALLAGIFVLFIVYSFVKVELSNKIAYDTEYISAERLGRAPGISDYIVMVIGGFFGPFPSFIYNTDNQLGLLQTVGNFVKIIFSYFFLLGSYFTLKFGIKKNLPLLIFIILNTLVLVLLAASLDYRFLYPFMPLYFVIMAFGYVKDKEYPKPLILRFPFYFMGAITLIILFNYR